MDAKRKTNLVFDQDALKRELEEMDTRAREAMAEFEAGSALIDEMLRLIISDLKKRRPQIEIANDPKLLLPYLQVVRALVELIDRTIDVHRSLLQSDESLAEKMSLEATAENDPEIKSYLVGVSAQARTRAASSAEKLQEMEFRKQRRSEILASITAGINELVAKPSDEKE